MRIWRPMVWTLVACLTLAAAAWAVVLFEILPRIDDWRDELSQQATRAIGVPVQIGRVSGEIEGAWPVLTLSDVRLLDGQGSPALQLKEVTARLSPTSLLPWAVWRNEWRFDRLVLVEPDLAVFRDRAGEVFVAGLRISSPPSAKQSGPVSGLDWLLSQSLIQIKKGRVQWTDAKRQAPTVGLTDVEASLRNRAGLGRYWHELEVVATPSREFGRRGQLRVSMTQPLWQLGEVIIPAGTAVPWWRRLVGVAPKPSQWETWSGTAQADLPEVDVQGLKQYVDLPIEVNGGRGSLNAEFAIQSGHPQGVMLGFAVKDVSVRLAPQLPLLGFKSVTGRASLTHEPGVSVASYESLAFETREAEVWPKSSAQFEWRHGALSGWPPAEVLLKQTQGGAFKADRLDLAMLAKLADRLPLPSKLRDVLRDLAPQGIVTDLVWQWDGMLDAPKQYRLAGVVDGLGWDGDHESGLPGVGKSHLKFSGDESGGRANLSIADGWLDFPGIFEEPRIPVHQLSGDLVWRITKPKRQGQPSDIDLEVRSVRFANADAQGMVDATWQTGGRDDAESAPRFPGVMSMKGKLSSAQANRVWRYLPLVIPDSARYYVRDAIKQGMGEQVNFEVSGDLNKFPFPRDEGGRFRVHVPVRQVLLDYVPGATVPGQSYWPAFSNLDGNLIFAGQSMRIEKATARLGGLGTGGFQLRDVTGLIDDLASNDPHLVISGHGDGPLDDALKYLSTSPVGAWTGNMLGRAHGTGKAALKLQLDIPLDRVDATRLKGAVTLKESDVAAIRLAEGLPLFEGVVGEVGFTESVLSVKARTRLWGRDVSVEGRRDLGGIPYFEAHGVMTAEALREAREWPLLAQLAQRVEGSTPFSVVVDIPKGEAGAAAYPRVEVRSSLQGMSSNLPAPLTKPADAIWPLSVTYQLERGGTSDALVVDLSNPQVAGGTQGAPWLKVDLRHDVSSEPSVFQRGLISLLQWNQGALSVPTLPGKGLTVEVDVPHLDLDAWKAVGQSFQTSGGGGFAKGPVGPNLIAVRSPSVVYQQRTLKDVNATLAQPSPGVWSAQIESQQVAGKLEWITDTAAGGAAKAGGRVAARLQRLSIPAADAQALEEQAVEQLLRTESQVASVPALDIVIEQFEWRGLALGRLEVEAVNRLAVMPGGGQAPEWSLTKFKLGAPEAALLSATGVWTAANASGNLSKRAGGRGKAKSSFDFSLDLKNFGDTLARLGLPKTVRGGKGLVSGQVSWLGTPLEPDPATMSGDLTVAINDGQFLKADPGVAKLLGVLSLQSLPRRLTLDFRDLFQQGFAFDGIDGQISIQQGVAQTRNLRMRGVQAVVLMEGQADLIKETQDLHVFVIPDVNAVGASLAYAAINPVVGLGTFVAQMMLRKQVSEAATQEFLVKGSWADPSVEKLKSQRQVPDAATAPSKQSSLGRIFGGV